MKGFYGIVRRRKMKDGTAIFVLATNRDMFVTKEAAEKMAEELDKLVLQEPSVMVNTVEVKHYVVLGVT